MRRLSEDAGSGSKKSTRESKEMADKITGAIAGVPRRSVLALEIVTRIVKSMMTTRNRCALLLMMFSFLFGGCSKKPTSDFAFIDLYLTTWDAFARGDNNLAPAIKRNARQFNAELTAALKKADNRAPGRLVFYAVVQVGGFIPLDSELGQAFHERIGDAVPIFTSDKDGKQRYFAGDLYFWWEAHKSEYAPYPLYDDRRQREFTKNVALKLYEGASKTHK